MSRCNRRRFLAGLALIGATGPRPAAAAGRQAPRVRRIGFLIGEAWTMIAAFEDEMRRLGYADPSRVVVEKRVARSNTSDGQRHAAELAHMDLELIVAAALPQALAVRALNPAMPMVIGTCPGLVSNGFARSLERPGGIYTGMEELPPGVTEKRLRLLKTAAPRLSRIALLSTTPGRGGHEVQVAEAEQTAKALSLTVTTYRAASKAELETALAAIIDDGMQGFVSFQGGLSLANQALITDFASRHRLPAIYQSAVFTAGGGLLAWSPDQEEQFRIAARYVDTILEGARPGDLPIRHPDRYYLTINRTAARTIGLDVPAELLSQADFVLP